MNKNTPYVTTIIIVAVALIFSFLIPVFPAYDSLLHDFNKLGEGDSVFYLLLLYAFQVGFWAFFIYAFDVVSFHSEIMVYSDYKIPNISELPNQEYKDFYIENVVNPSQTEVWFEDDNWFSRWFFIASFFSIPCLSISAALTETALKHPISSFVSFIIFVSSYYCGRYFFRRYGYYFPDAPRQKYLTKGDVDYILENGYGKSFQKKFGFDETNLKNIVVVLERVKHYNMYRGDQSRDKARMFLGGFAIAVFLIFLIIA